MFDTNERFDAGVGILDTDHDAPLRIGYYLLRLAWQTRRGQAIRAARAAALSA